jgi:hypothetical protein
MKPKIWLFSTPIDVLGLGLPVWLTWLVCFLLPESFLHQPLPLWMWVVFILGIDVSHVWSTIFRTYLDGEEFRRHHKVLIFTPLLVFAILFTVALYSTLWFWRVMAYMALHHFIKQQYGFLAIYRAKYGLKKMKIFSDKWVIYLAMLYPVVFWHLDGKREFNWFVKGDFFVFNHQYIDSILLIFNYLYWLILACWLIEEINQTRKNQTPIAWGKILWMLTTAGNWYLGIVYFNSDVAFSLTNVVAHGIPYLTLIFVYVERKKIIKRPNVGHSIGKIAFNILMMILIVLLLALTEEYFWDLWLNRQKTDFFGQFLVYPIPLLQNPIFQAAALALLSIPQVSHYIIDGYIWKGGAKNPDLRAILN